VLCVSKTCLLLGTLLVGFAFHAWPQSYDTQQVIVSVYDDVGLSERTLAQTEQKAATVFEHAGLDVIWKNCSSSSANRVDTDTPVRAGEQGSPGTVLEKTAGLRPGGRVGAPIPTWSLSDCSQFEWPTHLAVRIVPKSTRWNNEVFGVAFLSAEGAGCYSDVFYDRATELQSTSNADLSDILGNVIAHELGHLLLGSNSHDSSGIMRARWEREDLSRAARGNLLFTAKEAEHMRRKLISARPLLAVTARASY
jgi:hypothetical protein